MPEQEYLLFLPGYIHACNIFVISEGVGPLRLFQKQHKLADNVLDQLLALPSSSSSSINC